MWLLSGQFGMPQMMDALSTRSLSEEGLVRGRKHERERNFYDYRPLRLTCGGDVCYRSITQAALTDTVREGDNGRDNTEQG